MGSIPGGTRVYAIGDIHGRLDLLDLILEQIDADDRGRHPAKTQLIFLGDLIDRGSESAQVVERLKQLSVERPETRFLLGNHEEVYLKALGGDLKALKFFTRIGGKETILSYGVSETEYSQSDYPELLEAFRRKVPAEHIDFVGSFEDMIVLGDYAFVHAGVRPDLSLAAQRPSDLRWIREPFLNHHGELEKIVVHGHTVTQEVDLRRHRIGIDTGAYASGRLTAIAIEGNRRWVLQATAVEGPMAAIA
jgi:serine/threonine protein phosphatase 1